jgi:serine/threonine protein kinase
MTSQAHSDCAKRLSSLANDRNESPDFLRREIAALQSLSQHPNIADLYGAFEDDEHVYLAMELCTGGELFQRIITRSAAILRLEALRLCVSSWEGRFEEGSSASTPVVDIFRHHPFSARSWNAVLSW